MEIMGGQIHVTSEPGQGSTFWFYLSLTTVDRNRFQQRHSTSTPLTTSRRLVGLYILVVDDSLAIRQLVQQLLEREGAQVTIAADGAHALTVLQQADEPFDCVMMDIQMPVMDGLTATQNIRALPQFDNLPVLAMTAGLFAEQQARARQAGMTDVIAKPIDIDHMINQILISVGRNNGGHGSNGATNPNPMPLIAGIDRDHVNRTLDGDSKLFDKLVLIFIQEFEGLDDRIRECLAQDDHPYSIKEAIRFSHTLNGAASQIGAIELSQAAVALEQALTNESGASLPKLDAMGKLLADLISSLKQHLASL
jgi:CheY-like chemotaxis protein